MKIKNKAELLRRVRSNVREDVLTNSLYAHQIERGKKKAQVCGIGCLALPHRVKERLAFYKSSPNGYGDPGLETKRLGEEFGITPSLALLLEALFVPLNRRGEGQDFLRDFAKHIPEGAAITDAKVFAFCREVGMEFSRYDADCAVTKYAMADIWSPQDYDAPNVRNALFAWFDNGARVKGISLKEAS